MSTIVPRTATTPNRLSRLLERDYFPGLEPYVAWLRQPVGWFIVATIASILVGVTLSPLALSLAAGLISLLTLGLAYPWLAVRLARCEVSGQRTELEEDESHEVQVLVRNRCPWPLWGLMIEGFVVNPHDERDNTLHDAAHPNADIALGSVPWLSQASYQLTIRPRLRGRYPLRSPQLTCAFPFGLWTARRPIEKVSPVVVQPRQVKLTGMMEQSGRTSHHSGTGSRSGGHGDFLGLRAFRAGDSMRHIHWAHTARLDSLVVCERSSAEQSPWQIVLDPSNHQPGRWASRENLAWRVRTAASLCTLLYQQSIPFQLAIRGEESWSGVRPIASSGNPIVQALTRLTDVPIDGVPAASADSQQQPALQQTACSITITAAEAGAHDSETINHNLIILEMFRAASDWRQTAESRRAAIDLNRPIALQINTWLQRLSHGRHVG